jgi:ABC-type cobalamin transport system permease subunit
VIPGWTLVVVAASWIWMVAAMVTAVRHALDYQRLSRTLSVCVIGAALAIGMAVLLSLLMTPTVA